MSASSQSFTTETAQRVVFPIPFSLISTVSGRILNPPDGALLKQQKLPLFIFPESSPWSS